MNFWDKVQHEIKASSSRLVLGRKGRKGSSEDSGVETPGSSGQSVFSPTRKLSGISRMDEDLGLADEILASPVKEARQSGRGTTATSRPENNTSVPPPRARRTGGWADDAPPKTANRERFQEGEELLNRDSDDDVPAIPDLDDVQAEDFSSQVALAPSVAVNRVATFKELDSDLFRHGAFATLDDVDLRALVKCMAPEPETKELDAEWSWDALFTEVSSEILKDQLSTTYPEDEEEKKKYDPSAVYIG